jgi:hypothetical protein
MDLLIWPLVGGLLSFASSAQQIEADIGQGYKQASLNWSISGPENFPNVLSELKWKNLKIWDSHAKVAFKKCNWVMRFEGNWGKIYEGYNVDDDYGADDHKKRFSHSRAAADKGSVWDFTAILGYELSCLGFSVLPYGGWGKDVQKLKMRSPAHQEFIGPNHPYFPTDDTFEAPIEGLNSSYHTHWQGPLIGVDLSCRLRGLSLFGGYEYHWLHYGARAHWNLRQEFVEPFLHSGSGRGIKIRMGATFDLTCNFYLGLLATITDYRLKNGLDKTVLIMNDNPVEIKTRLNGVHWHAYSITANFGIRF